MAKNITNYGINPANFPQNQNIEEIKDIIQVRMNNKEKNMFLFIQKHHCSKDTPGEFFKNCLYDAYYSIINKKSRNKSGQ